ncbi:Ig-like domain-containing protein, partial [Litorivivens sp.]|uniref:PKD domain-containing protein n=1 Tax=Litorivivens sp. TaxID=2020868 RepID=UPI0035699EB0
GVALDNPTVTIRDSDKLVASFDAPEVSQDINLYFTLSVVDSRGGKGSDTVAILVADDTDLDPVANAGPDQRVGPGAVVTLDGSLSDDDLDGNDLAYSWAQVGGENVELTGADTRSPTFTAPSPENNAVLIFQLTVTDSAGQSDSDTVQIDIQVNPGLNPPTVDAGNDQNAVSGEVVVLDGSASDQDGDPLTYTWTQVGATDETRVTISDADSPQASFTAPDVDQTTELTFSLTVSDGLSSRSDQTKVTVVPAPSCSIEDPATYSLCFEACSDQNPETACLVPIEGDPAAVFDQLNACADRDPATVCPLPVEQQPGGGDPVVCDSTNPETYGQCFADCTDQDVTTACPLPVEGDPGVPGELQEVLDQLDACADRDPATVCPLPVEQQPGGGDPVACD